MVTVERILEGIGTSPLCRCPIDRVAEQERGLTVETTVGTGSSTSQHTL